MKINLEESLIRANRKIVTPENLLLINEYERHAELVENDALQRIGLNKIIKEGATIKSGVDGRKDEASRFKQERVFHISQIKAVCDKYYLRFLESEYYKGTIDNDLPSRITNFEIAYGVRCNAYNTKICAPLESFNLEEKPKDPLLFYQINSEYYYLIHKWGNDLSVTRSFLGLLSNGLFCWLAPVFLASLSMLFQFGIGCKLTALVFILWSFICGIHVLVDIDNKPVRFLRKNKWESRYIDD